MTFRLPLILVVSAVSLLAVMPTSSTAQIQSRPPDDVQLVSATDDGVIDSLYIWKTRGGSGWKQSAECIRDGSSGTKICRTWYSTAYSFFSNIQIHPAPSTSTEKALAEYLMPECEPPDSTRPEQAVMWKLAHPTAQNLKWHKGKPKPPVDVCLTVSQAETLARSTSTPGGQPEDEPGQWLAYYSNFWRDRSGIHDSAKVVVERKTFTIYRWRHSLAIYVPAQDQHAWFLNKGESDGIFKVDRWDRFADIRYRNGALEVDVRPGLAETETVQLDIGQLMP
jgi:hypothetical protein